jgi:hypothetical protein
LAVATQRFVRPSRVGGLRGRDTRRADSLVQIISILGAHRRELKASVGERLRLLDERASASESRHTQLEDRLSGLEDRLKQFDRARAAQSQRHELRHKRIVILRQQLEILHGRVVEPSAEARQRSRTHQLGSVLMYVGGLLVLWAVLLELGLALGLS